MRVMDTTALLVGAVLLLVGAVAGGLAGLALGRRSSPPGRPPGGADTPAQVAALLGPASQALLRVEDRLREVERDRVGAYAGLREQVAALHRASVELGAQARALAGALRSPQVRGRWGEVQLQRIVELAGMVEHCDFSTQVARTRGEPGRGGARGVRPDMVVHLSGGRHVPVDAKVPFAAWLEALETTDPLRQEALLAAHARAMRAHVDALAAKAYWEAFQPAPEFVVLFVPGEPLLDAALAKDPGLAEHAFARSVVLATPTSLIALLRTIAFTWRQERLSRSAAEVHALGRELHGRLGTLAGHLGKVGSNLGRAVDSYNDLVGSVEQRVLVTARRLADLGVSTDVVEPVSPVGSVPRRPTGLADAAAADRRDPGPPRAGPGTPGTADEPFGRAREVTVDR
jgi:DNA recombination protein RmuC